MNKAYNYNKNLKVNDQNKYSKHMKNINKLSNFSIFNVEDDNFYEGQKSQLIIKLNIMFLKFVKKKKIRKK
jgi:hypothetical protein